MLNMVVASSAAISNIRTLTGFLQYWQKITPKHSCWVKVFSFWLFVLLTFRAQHQSLSRCTTFSINFATHSGNVNFLLVKTLRELTGTDCCPQDFTLYSYQQKVACACLWFFCVFACLCVCFQKAPKGQSRVERLRKKMNEQESWLLLHSPTIPFRIHNKHGKVTISDSYCYTASMKLHCSSLTTRGSHLSFVIPLCNRWAFL